MAARTLLRRLRIAVRRRTPVYSSVRRTTYGPFGRRLWTAVSRQTPAFGRAPNGWAPNGRVPNGRARNDHGATDRHVAADQHDAADQTEGSDRPAREAEQVADLRARVRGHLHD